MKRWYGNIWLIGKQEMASDSEENVKPPHKAPEFKSRLEKAMAEAEMDEPDLAATSGIPKRSINNYINKSEPPFGRGVLLAKALGVDPYWLAGIETPRPQASGIGAELTDMGSPEHNPAMRRKANERSVETVEVPRSAVRPGYAFGKPGHYQLVIDFVVTGPDDREIIPFGEKPPDVDDDA